MTGPEVARNQGGQPERARDEEARTAPAELDALLEGIAWKAASAHDPGALVPTATWTARGKDGPRLLTRLAELIARAPETCAPAVRLRTTITSLALVGSMRALPALPPALAELEVIAEHVDVSGIEALSALRELSLSGYVLERVPDLDLLAQNRSEIDRTLRARGVALDLDRAF